jgi:hypothetical protein
MPELLFHPAAFQLTLLDRLDFALRLVPVIVAGLDVPSPSLARRMGEGARMGGRGSEYAKFGELEPGSGQ